MCRNPSGYTGVYSDLWRPRRRTVRLSCLLPAADKRRRGATPAPVQTAPRLPRQLITINTSPGFFRALPPAGTYSGWGRRAATDTDPAESRRLIQAAADAAERARVAKAAKDKADAVALDKKRARVESGQI